MKTLKMLIASITLACGLAVGIPQTAQARAPITTGSASDGCRTNPDFLDASNELEVCWTRRSLATFLGAELNAYVNTHNLPDWNNHKTCVLIAADVVTPAQSLGHHFDYREWKNCDPHTDWNPPKFYEPHNTCFDISSGYYDCDVPIKRVMIARYSPWDAENGPSTDPSRGFITWNCWQSASGVGDCDGWYPRCAVTDLTPKTCTVWVKHEDGTVDKYGNTDAAHTTSDEM